MSTANVPLDQQSCLPIATLQGPSTAIADGCFVQPPHEKGTTNVTPSFFASADREGGIKLWNMSLRRVVAEASYQTLLDAYDDAAATNAATSNTTDENCAPGRKRRNPATGLLCIRDVTSHLVLPQGPEGDSFMGACPSHPVLLAVQGRNQTLGVILFERRNGEDAMAARMIATCDVAQFGFCKFSLLTLDESTQSTTPRCSVVVAVPDDAPTHQATGGATVSLYRIERVMDASTTSSSGIVLAVYPLAAVRVVDATVKCGQLMSLAMWVAEVPTSCTPQQDHESIAEEEASPTASPFRAAATALVCLVTTESGHAVISSHVLPSDESWVDRLWSPSTANIGTNVHRRYCIHRCCAESLMAARLWLPPRGLITPEVPVLVTVSAEGHIHGYRCGGVWALLSRANNQERVVVPRWPLLWEHATTKGLAVVDVVDMVSSNTAHPLVVTGGWDGVVALLDGITGGIVTSIQFHDKSISGVYIAAPTRTSQRCPAFARAARMSRVGVPASSKKARGSSSTAECPLVFLTSCDGGTIAVWRFEL